MHFVSERASPLIYTKGQYENLRRPPCPASSARDLLFLELQELTVQSRQGKGDSNVILLSFVLLLFFLLLFVFLFLRPWLKFSFSVSLLALALARALTRAFGAGSAAAAAAAAARAAAPRLLVALMLFLHFLLLPLLPLLRLLLLLLYPSKEKYPQGGRGPVGVSNKLRLRPRRTKLQVFMMQRKRVMKEWRKRR